jgi:energy-coupling factor transporter ATP-binding protein EcfA2
MTLREDLYEWLTSQPEWQQDLARRLVSRPQLDTSAYDEALRLVKYAFGALGDDETAPRPQPISLDDLPAGGAGQTAPRLVGFGRLQGVGAVAADQELRFAPNGLTVIYGANAAGKTTYVRGLKRVCRTVDCEGEVYGNVFVGPTAGAAPASAKVELVVSGAQVTQQVNLADPPDLNLDAISVFDARCAELYVDEQNAVAYIPSALLLLARLAATQDQMRRDLSAEAEALEATCPSFPELAAPTGAKARVDALSATTNLEELRAFAHLNDEEQARLAELRAVIASAETHSAPTDAQAAQQDAVQAQSLSQRLRSLGARVATPEADALRSRATEAATATEAVGLAASQFAELPVAGVGSEPWQRLWQAAREFSEAHSAKFPPDTGEHCPLCLQEIAAGSSARMTHFEEHVRSSLQADARAARQALTEALESVDERHVAGCRTAFLEGLADREAELHTAIERYLRDIDNRMQALRQAPTSAQGIPVLNDSAQRLEEWGLARAVHAETLLAAQDPNRERELRAELAELDVREKLGMRFVDITAWVGTLGHISALWEAHRALATNRITSKQRQLSDAAVTQTLGEKLDEELRNLRCGHMPVDIQPHTAVGETQVVLRLAGAHGAPRVSDILSEGEQRALSLAFFLAEVGTAEHDGGIIVDDPVSSLDDERRAYIAKRLVAETATRQVVVFTHDLAFLLDVLDQAEAAGVEPLVQGVWRMGSEVGRVDEHPPFATMKLRARVGVLEDQVEHWDEQNAPADFDEAWRRVCDFYGRMRMTWERAVEERLFRGVVQRLQRAVKTLALKDVVITEELVDAVNGGMTRCSYFVHDAPPGTGTSLPGRRELAEDVGKLRDFERQTRST